MEAKFLSNVGHIESEDIWGIVLAVRITGLQVKLKEEWDGFTASPERVLQENEQLASALTKHRDAVMCWMIASSVLATGVGDDEWQQILDSSEEVSPDLNVKYSVNVRKLEDACEAQDLESSKLYARRALTIWHAMAGQHKRIAEAENNGIDKH